MRVEFDDVVQSLLNSLRSAFMFTLVGFLYGDNKCFYSSFNEYFTNEFTKRVVFLHNNWSTKDREEKIEYIPIFESFYNLDGLQALEVINKIKAIFTDDNIKLDDKNIIRTTLLNNAEKFHKELDSQSIQLEQAIVKPVVNYIIEIEKAKSDYSAAKSLYSLEQYNQSINRSYYSMMHALKALLERKGKLSEWQRDMLNVSENHKKLEIKLSR